MTHPPITRGGAHRAAQHELSKAIYHRQSEPLAVRAVRAFGHLLDRIIGSAITHAPAGSAGALALVALIAVLVTLLIWRVGLPRRAADHGAVFAPGRTETAADHRALAVVAAEQGDWTTAVVERMRAVARELEERGVLDQRAGRTATELTTEAGRALPESAAVLGAAAETFNTVVYGGTAATADLAAVMATADDAVRTTRRNAMAVRL
jgi:hypothetical protein